MTSKQPDAPSIDISDVMARIDEDGTDVLRTRTIDRTLQMIDGATDINMLEVLIEPAVSRVMNAWTGSFSSPTHQQYVHMVEDRIEWKRAQLAEQAKAHPDRVQSKRHYELLLGSDGGSSVDVLHRRLTDELRAEAERQGVSWDDLLDAAALSKGSRSRLNNGLAGLPTIAKVRAALEERLGHRVTIVPVEVTRPPRQPSSIEQPRKNQAADRLRWVVVETVHGKIFAGPTTASDEQIAASGHIRLESCVPISGADVQATALAASGPGSGHKVGSLAPGALILGVTSVYDCSDAAIRAFRGSLEQ